MALRSVTLTPAARRLTLTRDGWRKQVETTLAQAAAALRANDLPTLATRWDELDGWGDEQRAYQARRQLVEQAFTTSEGLRVDRWIAHVHGPLLRGHDRPLVVDLGANGGFFALRFADLWCRARANQAFSLVAVEGAPRTYAQLERHLRHRGEGTWRCRWPRAG